TEDSCSKRNLIRRDRRSTEMRNKPLLNRCVRQRGKIEDTALCRVAQQTFGQRPALQRRSGKENRPNTPAHAREVRLLFSSIDGCNPACHYVQLYLLL